MSLNIAFQSHTKYIFILREYDLENTLHLWNLKQVDQQELNFNDGKQWGWVAPGYRKKMWWS